MSDDPYGDFALAVMKACRIAESEQGEMNDTEFDVVQQVKALMIRLDPANENIG